MSESVDKYAEESVSANFVSIEETEVSANAIKKEDEETDAEMTAGTYSGTDGDLIMIGRERKRFTPFGRLDASRLVSMHLKELRNRQSSNVLL